MVNIGFGWGSLIGIVLAVAGASLYFLRSVRPNLARDYDIFFAAVGLLCGGILFLMPGDWIPFCNLVSFCWRAQRYFLPTKASVCGYHHRAGQTQFPCCG